MPNADALAYGMHLVYDGGHADPSRLADRALVERMVLEVAAVLGAAEALTDAVVVEEISGVSAGVALAEASVALHAFPGLAALCLDVFSVQRRQAESLYVPVEGAFAIGRSNSRRANRARAPRPGDPATLARRLSGERAYAEARFTDLESIARV
jgi:S-adenosylmethionine/arginine decarboxylase-like enzyme